MLLLLPTKNTLVTNQVIVRLTSKALDVFAENEQSKSTLLAGTDGHLQYPPMAIPAQMVEGVGYQSLDLAA